MTQEKFLEKCDDLVSEIDECEHNATYGSGHLSSHELEEYAVRAVRKQYQLQRFLEKHPEYSYEY